MSGGVQRWTPPSAWEASGLIPGSAETTRMSFLGAPAWLPVKQERPQRKLSGRETQPESDNALAFLPLEED